MTHSEQFLIYLRSALNHLYDPYFLRSSPLVKLFGLGDGPDTPAALQRILNEGIAELEPKLGKSLSSQDRRDYELIMYRYVQQFSQEEVANQLGVSVRHLRREQNAAVYRLGAALWERYHLGVRPLSLETLEQEDASAASTQVGDDDLNWLANESSYEPALLQQVLPAVIDLTRPLAAAHAVEIQYTLPETLPAIAMQPVALRQVLLNVISATISCTREKQLLIEAAPVSSPGGEADRAEPQVEVEFSFLSGDNEDDPTIRPLNSDGQASLDLAKRMVRLFQGDLECSMASGRLSARLWLPAISQIDVLVIDDNADFLQLLQRETTGTRYKVVGVREPMHGLRIAEEQQPDAVLLDVMMPRVDGWEILGRLHNHPATAHIPVIICSILPQEELALSLGAKGFLRKPVSREQVLAILDKVAGSSGAELSRGQYLGA